MCSKFKTERISVPSNFVSRKLSVRLSNLFERVLKCLSTSASGFCGSVCGNLRVEFSVFIIRPVVNVYLIYIRLKSLLKLNVTNAIIVVLDLFAGLLVSAVQTNAAFADANYVKI